MDIDFSTFEPFMGELPYTLVSYHPDGKLVALQVIADHPQTNISSAFSAIWDRSTGKIVWAPEYTIALAWLPDGREIGMLRNSYDYDPQAHQIIGSALQSEFTHTWERRSWPEKTLISACEIQMPTGWPTTLAVSPRQNLVVFQWMDQCEAGLEFIVLNEGEDHQLLDAGLPLSTSVRPICLRENGNGYPIGGSNLVTGLAFSTDGRYVAFPWQGEWEWWAERNADGYITDGMVAKVGSCQVGWIEIIDWDKRQVRTVPVTVDLSADWKHPFLNMREELMVNVQFIDDTHFTIHLPTGEVRTYDVREA